MNMSHVTKAWVLLLVGVTLVAGCARSPEAKKARHLERGDKYFSKAQYREALIEYANVLQLDQAEARQQVAEILGKDPKNFEALLLWAGAASTPQEVDAAIQRLEETRADHGD